MQARFACAGLLAAILAASFWLVLSRSVSLDDDNTYFFLTGVLLGASPEQIRDVRAMDEAIVRRGFERGHSPDYLVRVMNRLRYPLPTACYALSGAAVRAVYGEPTPESFAFHAARTVQLGYCASFAVAAALVVAALWRSRDPVWWGAVLVGVAAIGALDLLDLPKTHVIKINPSWDGLVRLLGRSVRLLIDPTDNFSAFGFAPRSNIALLMVGVASLRWNGERALGWALLGVAMLYNVYYVAPLGGILLASDLAASRWSPLARRAGPWSTWSIGRRMAFDQAAFAAAFLALVPVAFGVVALEAWRVGYFTGIVHQRALSAWQPLVVVSAAYLVLVLAGARRRATRGAVPGLAVAAAIALALPTFARLREADSPQRRLLDGAQAREQRLQAGQPISREMTYGDQAVLFYAQAKTIVLRRDFVSGLLARDASAVAAPVAGSANP